MDEEVRIAQAFIDAAARGPFATFEVTSGDERPFTHAAVQACRELTGGELLLLVAALLVACADEAPAEEVRSTARETMQVLAVVYARSVMKEPWYCIGKETLQ